MSELEKQYEELKRNVKRSSYDVFIKNNPATREAYFKAIEEIIAFEQKYGIKEKQ